MDRQKIADYWKNKGLKIHPSWENALTECWACWRKVPYLERCHIIPRALGGNTGLSNTLLLCSICNDQNPETIYKDDYMLWFNSRVKREKDYFVNIDHSVSVDQEYIDIYEKAFENVILTYYFGNENIIKGSAFFGALQKEKYIAKTAASKAIIIHKYKEFLIDIIENQLACKVEESREKHLNVLCHTLGINLIDLEKVKNGTSF